MRCSMIVYETAIHLITVKITSTGLIRAFYNELESIYFSMFFIRESVSFPRADAIEFYTYTTYTIWCQQCHPMEKITIQTCPVLSYP